MAPARSWHLLLLLLPLVIAQVATEAHDTLSCFYNSRANISCVWSPAGGLPDLSCRVNAKPQNRTWSKKCDLFPAVPASWACDLILDQNPNAQKLTSADKVIMSVQCQEAGNWRTVMSQEFKPFNSLRLFAPCSLQVTPRETQFCSNVTWRVPHSSHYVESHLEFEVQKKTLSQAWGDTPLLALKQNQKWICLESLAPDTPYELRVRVRVQPQRGQRPAWSPWSEPLDFRTPQAAMTKKPPPFVWLYPVIWGVSGTVAFILLTYLLATSRHMGSWLKKFVKCHIPDPSEFFIQLSSEHGGDFQKWLSSPFPSSAYSPSGLAPEISPLEVLDRDAKTAQRLRLQQAQGPSSPTPSSLSLASGFTNQGYFFFHLPDALEVESCQVYFTYDPCEDEPEEGLPEAPPLPALPAHPGESEAYCTFPPGDDLLLFTPVLLGAPAPLSAAPGSTGPSQDQPSPSLQNGVPRDDTPQPPRPHSPGAHCQVQLDNDVGEAGEEPPDPSPWASPPGSGRVKAAASCLPSNPDAYVSLQELQDQEPAHSV